MGYYINIEPGVKVFIEDLNPSGNHTIVFLHGWPGSHELFEYQFDQLAKKGYRCIGIDQRGFGKSDRPLTGYDYNTLADDVKCVLDTLELRDITLLGHSTGGSIAVKYMGRHNGHRVSRLVLCAAAAPSLIKRPNFPYGQDKNMVLDIIHGTYTDRPQMLRDFGKKFFYQPISEALSDWFFSLGLVAAGWATAAIAETWIREVLFDDLESIRVPTLIIHGIHDEVVPFALGEIQNKMIGSSYLLPFKTSGHATFYDEMDKFNRELMKFTRY